MQKRTEKSRKFGRISTLVGALGIAACLTVPAAAGADASASANAMSLVFASGQAHQAAGNVAVPVQCLGSGDGFCSGVVTLSRSGHSISIPFSVRGGGNEVLFVPLRVSGHGNHPRKVHGVATTDQALGPATSAKQFLYTR
jgi:hypothetical protein